MKIASVVCEFNPFHNGHAYLLEKLRREYGADYIIAIMSGNYVQRGEPAIFDKYRRAEMALKGDGADGHADLVIELPTIFSCASAGEFAAAGVRMAVSTGITDILGFGVEGGADLSDIRRQAELLSLLESDGADNAELKRLLKSGMSYPEAVATYTESMTRRHGSRPDHAHAGSSENPKPCGTDNNENAAAPAVTQGFDAAEGRYQTNIGAAQGLTEKDTQSGRAVNIYASNNILAAEYLAALDKYDAEHRIQPAAIVRVGDGYAREEASDDRYCSATALRKYICTQTDGHGANYVYAGAGEAYSSRKCDADGMQDAYAAGICSCDNDISAESDHEYAGRCTSDTSKNRELHEFIGSYVPAELQGMYGGRIDSVDADMLSEALSLKLLEAKYRALDLTRYTDVSREIADRLMKNADRSMSFTERAAAVKTRQYTYTRVSRALLHIALGISKADFILKKGNGIEYIRILGFRRDASELLKALKNNASVPIISKTADGAELLRSELYYSGIYNVLSGGRSEYERSPVMV